jgi:hypothetical protein
MAAVATNPAVAKKTKIPQSVGKEFMEADKGKKFKGGGEMKESKEMVKKEIGFMKKKGAPKSMIKHEMKEAGMKKMASGGLAAGHKSADGIAMKGKTKGKEVKMAFGGAALGALSRAAKQTKASLPGSPMTSKPLSGMLQKAAGRGAVPQAAAKPLSGMLQKAAGRGAVPQAAAKPPARTQQQSNADAARAYSNYKPSTTIAGGSMPPSRTTLLGGSMKPPTGGMMGAGQRGIGSQMASKPQMGGVNSALKKVGTTVSRAVMGRKAGGLAAGHKEADGIAKKGKTRAMQVKMAGGGKTKKYC